MKARIEHDWVRGDIVKVWIFDPGVGHGGVRMLGFGDHGETLWENVEEGATMPDPSMRLPVSALEALVKAASGVLPPSDATVDALKDARTVRDRLLVLVEKVVKES